MSDAVELLGDILPRLDNINQVATLARIKWLSTAKSYQVPPPLEQDWTVWMLLAGRGSGKSRSAAEALWWWAWTNPDTRSLVMAPTSGDIKHTCFEGESGLLSCIPAELIEDYNKSDHIIKLVNGSSIRGISADTPERLRGPQHHMAWCLVAGTQITLHDGTTKNVEDMTTDDVVMTRHGPRRVTAAGISNNPNDVVTIVAGDTRLTLTVDHPILVSGQWIPAGEIKEGDLLCGLSSTTVFHGINLHQAITETNAEDGSTDTSGLSTKAPSLKGGSFITRMKIQATTTLQTLKQCLKAITSGYTLLGASTQKNKDKTSPKYSGSIVKKTKLSTQRSVFNAEKASQVFHSPIESTDTFARQNVQTNGEQDKSLFLNSVSVARADLTTLLSNPFRSIVPSSATANQLSAPIATTQLAVRSVERSPSCTTYNLTVEGVHEYFANGICVHNCDELGAYQYIQEAWDMAMFGLRLGDAPRVIVTTTPRPKDLIIELLEREDCIVDRASTYQNLDNLAPTFKAQIMQYEGTKLGRQEIYGELIDPEESGVVTRDMFRLWPNEKPLPDFEYIIQSYDCAYSEKTHNDPTAATTWGVFKPLDGPMAVLLIDCWQEHLSFPDLKPKVIEEYQNSYGDGKKQKRPDLILVEDKAAGISLIQELQRAHLPVRGWNPGRADKMQRLQIAATVVAAGRVWLPESSVKSGYVRDWVEPMLSQLCSFPESSHDDFVDSTSMALRFLKDTGWLEINPPPRDDEDWYADDAAPKRTNPYAV